MAHLHSRSSARPSPVVLVMFGTTALAVACGGGGGGGGAKTPAKVGASDAGADSGSSQLSSTPPPSGLPPMAVMPPPGVAGSKRAKKKADSTLAACGGSAKATAAAPSDHVKKIGEGCASASRMKPLGPMMRGQQTDKDAHQENKFHAEANHCYRLYFAGDEGVKDVVVVLRDSAGDVIAEAPGPAVPDNGTACFTAADEVSVLVGVGSGKGAWAAQVWGD